MNVKCQWEVVNIQTLKNFCYERAEKWKASYSSIVRSKDFLFCFVYDFCLCMFRFTGHDTKGYRIFLGIIQER